MALGHEKLEVYRLAIGYVASVFEHSDPLNGVHRLAWHRFAGVPAGQASEFLI
ncbi:MAG TPA: hypothetical protein VMN36_09450 [Verrucomicrobiales bacterium]|nr:hypothetical protein [Verrucomicrobiales bacterium]